MRILNWIVPAVIAAGMASTSFAQDNTIQTEEIQPEVVQPTSAPASTTAVSSVIPSAAATYATLQGDIGEIGSKPLASQADIEQKLETLGGHNPAKLTSGWLSYSALVAAQNREFAMSMRDLDGYYGRKQVMAVIAKNPAFVTTLDGGDNALKSALAAAKADSRRMESVAAFLESQESTLQNQGWVKERIRDGKARADKLLSMSYSGRPVSESARQLFAADNVGDLLQNAGNPGATSVWDRASLLVSKAPGSALSSFTGPDVEVNPTRSATANNMAALAAYEILGAADPTDAGVKKALNDRKAEDCFDFAQLQLRGCVAGQSDHYGLQACLREHAISDVGECVGEVVK